VVLVVSLLRVRSINYEQQKNDTKAKGSRKRADVDSGSELEAESDARSMFDDVRAKERLSKQRRVESSEGDILFYYNIYYLPLK
jgi:hypothetical protein